jgi:hypothetical protein
VASAFRRTGASPAKAGHHDYTVSEIAWQFA